MNTPEGAEAERLARVVGFAESLQQTDCVKAEQRDDDSDGDSTGEGMPSTKSEHNACDSLSTCVRHEVMHGQDSLTGAVNGARGDQEALAMEPQRGDSLDYEDEDRCSERSTGSNIRSTKTGSSCTSSGPDNHPSPSTSPDHDNGGLQLHSDIPRNLVDECMRQVHHLALLRVIKRLQQSRMQHLESGMPQSTRVIRMQSQAINNLLAQLELNVQASDSTSFKPEATDGDAATHAQRVAEMVTTSLEEGTWRTSDQRMQHEELKDEVAAAEARKILEALRITLDGEECDIPLFIRKEFKST